MATSDQGPRCGLGQPATPQCSLHVKVSKNLRHRHAAARQKLLIADLRAQLCSALEQQEALRSIIAAMQECTSTTPAPSASSAETEAGTSATIGVGNVSSALVAGTPQSLSSPTLLDQEAAIRAATSAAMASALKQYSSLEQAECIAADVKQAILDLALCAFSSGAEAVASAAIGVGNNTSALVAGTPQSFSIYEEEDAIWQRPETASADAAAGAGDSQLLPVPLQHSLQPLASQASRPAADLPGQVDSSHGMLKVDDFNSQTLANTVEPLSTAKAAIDGAKGMQIPSFHLQNSEMVSEKGVGPPLTTPHQCMTGVTGQGHEVDHVIATSLSEDFGVPINSFIEKFEATYSEQPRPSGSDTALEDFDSYNLASQCGLLPARHSPVLFDAMSLGAKRRQALDDDNSEQRRDISFDSDVSHDDMSSVADVSNISDALSVGLLTVADTPCSVEQNLKDLNSQHLANRREPLPITAEPTAHASPVLLNANADVLEVGKAHGSNDHRFKDEQSLKDFNSHQLANKCEPLSDAMCKFPGGEAVASPAPGSEINCEPDEHELSLQAEVQKYQKLVDYFVAETATSDVAFEALAELLSKGQVFLANAKRSLQDYQSSRRHNP